MTKKIIASIFMAILIISIPNRVAYAGYWSENFSANGMKQVLEEISTQIRTGIAASAKMMSIKQATSMIEDSLYGGDSSSQRNIENFQSFLVDEPSETAITYGQDFLTNTLRGTTSGDYTPSGGSGSDFLSQSLEQAGESVLDGWEGKNQQTVDYQEHCSGGDFFADGNFKCFSAVMSNPVNTPTGMALATNQAIAAKYQEENMKAQVIASSTGFLPQMDENGNVTLPSSVVEEIQLKQITLPLDALASGDSNVFSSLIQSFATQMISNTFDQGLSKVQSSKGQNLKAFQRQFDQDFDNLKKQSGPGIEYSNDPFDSAQKQNNSNWVNPDLAPPGL